MIKKKMLLYSFSSVTQVKESPAYQLVKQIGESIYKNLIVTICKLPLDISCYQLLEDEIIREQPDIILGIGLDLKGNKKVTLEKIALNYIDHRNADDQLTANDHKIADDSPIAYESNFEITKLYDHLIKNEIPVEVSNFGGIEFSNYTYYKCLQEINRKRQTTRVLFIHIPDPSKNTREVSLDTPSLPLNLIKNSLVDYIINEYAAVG